MAALEAAMVEVLSAWRAVFSRREARDRFREFHPLVLAALEDRAVRRGKMRIGEGADGDAVTAGMVGGLPIDGRAAIGTEVEAQLAPFHEALMDARRAAEHDLRGFVISADAERGTRPALALDAVAQRHDRGLALGARGKRAAAAACGPRAQSCLITCSALETENAPGSSTSSTLTTPL